MRFLPNLDPTRRAILGVGISATVVFLLLTLETKVPLSSSSWIVNPWSERPWFWPFTAILVTALNFALWTPGRPGARTAQHDLPAEPTGPSRKELKEDADLERRLGRAERRIRARSSRAQRAQTPEQQ